MAEIKTINDLPSEMNTLITSFVKAKPDEELTLEELCDKCTKVIEAIDKKTHEDVPGKQIWDIKRLQDKLNTIERKVRSNKELKEAIKKGDSHIYLMGLVVGPTITYKIPREKFVSLEDCEPTQYGVYSAKHGEIISIKHMTTEDYEVDHTLPLPNTFQIEDRMDSDFCNEYGDLW